MTDQLLTVLRFALLGLIYLFFGRVLWAVWSQVRAPRVAGSATTLAMPRAKATKHKASKTEKKFPKMLVLEPRERRGEVFYVPNELLIGRTESCAITSPDDTFMSSLHARVYPSAEGVWVEDMGSTNGSFVNGHRLTAPKQLKRGDRLQVGHTVLEMQ